MLPTYSEEPFSSVELVFREYSDSYRDKPTGLEIVMHLE
jgi:hypothetical protein